MKKNKLKTKFKKVEWSKVFSFLIAVFMGFYGVWSGIEYYSLCKQAIENGTEMPSPELAIVCVSVLLASLMTYCLYQGALKMSLNKNKLTIEDGIVKPLLDECLHNDDEEE